MRKALAALAVVLASVSALFAATPLPPATTTLAAQTGNNTSAADSFLSAANGNHGAANISKVPIRSLLYPGATTKIYAHVEPWWGSGNHIDIGYSSQDPAQIHRQVTDMISRGLDGLAVDWYGPGSYEDLSDKLLLTEVESHPGFGMFIEIDHGAVSWHSCYPTCDATTAVIQLMTTVANQFFSSPAYEKFGGRPLLREFGMENLGVDWNAVQAQVPGNPLIIHRDNMGFTDPQTGGIFGWIQPLHKGDEPPNYDGMDYVNNLYAKATAQYPQVTMFATVFKGFNDIAASWAPAGGRHVEQNCGQTWLRTFAAINKHYSATRQLPALQLVTWNDYEEGTEVETGIDNCVTVSGDARWSSVQWSISGDESTVDHYTVYISSDDQNLAPLGDVPAGTHTFDLSAFAIPAGNYSVFVQAIGKPTLTNKMSAAIPVTVAADGTIKGPNKDVTLSASPSSATVNVGQLAQFQLAVGEANALDPVALSCSNLPVGAACAFSAASVVPGAAGANVTLTVTTPSKVAAVHPSSPRRNLPLYAAWMSGFGIVGLVTLPEVVRRNRRLALLTIVLGIAMVQLACGGGGAAQSKPTVTVESTAATSASYLITVNAVSGSIVRSANLTLTVH